MEHIIPQSHKELLQEILKQMIMENDPEATFVEYQDPPDPEPETPVIGGPIK